MAGFTRRCRMCRQYERDVGVHGGATKMNFFMDRLIYVVRAVRKGLPVLGETFRRRLEIAFENRLRCMEK